MTRDDIIRMAESVGVHEYGPHTRNWSFELSQLERFAALVAAAERCRMCEQFNIPKELAHEKATGHETN